MADDEFSSAPIHAHAADRLLHRIAAKSAPVCVGIDPVIGRLPRALQPIDERSCNQCAAAIGNFAGEVIRAVAPHVPCVKLQSACFERYRAAGLQALHGAVSLSRRLDLEVILDAKRGDIGITAEHYAHAAFGRIEAADDDDAAADWLTINSYLGEDGITPFLQRSDRHGAFALVRTSNPGGDAIQALPLADGRAVAHAVGELIARIGSAHVGASGYSSLGAVVGATRKHDAAALRALMPQQMFLVPGYGAQGGGVDDVLPCFHGDGRGAIVTASRSVIYAFDPDDPEWARSVSDAAASFAEEIARAVGVRR